MLLHRVSSCTGRAVRVFPMRSCVPMLVCAHLFFFPFLLVLGRLVFVVLQLAIVDVAAAAGSMVSSMIVVVTAPGSGRLLRLLLLLRRCHGGGQWLSARGRKRVRLG